MLDGKWHQIRVCLVRYPETGLSIPAITSEVCYEIISIMFLIFACVVWEN